MKVGLLTQNDVEERPNESNLINVYPNPAMDFIQLPATGAEFQIYNLSGKLLLSGMDNGKINISSLESGVYLVLSNDKYFKFVKE
jgi:hypothetical protein